MSGVWSFHDKTHWYYVSGLTISWQNRLILCLRLDHFMTKQMTKHMDTISGLNIFMTKQIDTISGAWPFHDKTDWYCIWGLTISWQNKLILCLGFDHFMTKHTDSMSGAWPFHDKTHWYYIWGLTISGQNTLILYLRLNHFMTK